ncbi:NfeD family protein [Mycoplasma leonicaptivi]|uniref:NfeD family protein n=1 Tax=Mycoplasma leonicaptivi TaxID=36742 RepID=UPI000688FF0E|nr:NfeD family protein [Mycoplasma leonicaptivi]
MEERIWIFIIVFWAIIISVFVVIEIFTTEIWSGLTAITALPSLLISIFVRSNQWWIFLIQFSLFVLLWTLTYYGGYKFLKKKIKYSQKVEQMIGIDYTTGYILNKPSKETIITNEDYGQIIINGKVFRAISSKGEGDIDKNSKVVISEIKGNILYIKKHKEEK